MVSADDGGVGNISVVGSQRGAHTSCVFVEWCGNYLSRCWSDLRAGVVESRPVLPIRYSWGRSR